MNLEYFNLVNITSFVILVILIILSGLVSASEVAFFSLSPNNIEKIRKKSDFLGNKILSLLNNPEKLLATILITSTFINIGIVIISEALTSPLKNNFHNPVIGFLVQTVIITFILLLLGEILPKAFATHNSIKTANAMVIPITFISKFFYPITFLLIKGSILIKKNTILKSGVSINDLSHAIDLTSNELKEDEKLLKSIINISNINVKEIIVSRIDVVTIDTSLSFKSVINIIIESGYSRLPVISGDFDNIKGILYIKDLLPHIHKTEFKWQTLIRPSYFIPETKMINDLLEEFQQKKIHMAIVIDEYGGTSGIVTLEDVLEEIVGEIDDEFDFNDSKSIVKISNKAYLVEAKVLINDFCRALNIPNDSFDKYKGDADSIAGLILEVKGNIPNKNEIIKIDKYNFRIKSVDDRRIKQVTITLCS